MTLDPRWAIGLALVIALLNYLTGIGSLLTDLGLPPTTVKAVMAIINIFSGMLATVSAVLAGIPSKDNKTGFIVKGPDKPAQP